MGEGPEYRPTGLHGMRIGIRVKDSGKGESSSPVQAMWTIALYGQSTDPHTSSKPIGMLSESVDR